MPVELKILNCFNISEKIYSKELDTYNENISNILTAQKKFSAQKINLQKDFLKTQERKKYVNTIWNVVHYISFAIPIVSGIAIFTESPVAGIILVVSGLAGFINKFVQDTGILKQGISLVIKDENNREKINKVIDGISQYTTLTFSCLTIVINPSGSVTIVQEILKIKNIADTTLNASKAIAITYKNMINFNISKYEKNIALITMQENENNIQSKIIMTNMKNCDDAYGKNFKLFTEILKT